jgi:hypothetical protein
MPENRVLPKQIRFGGRCFYPAPPARAFWRNTFNGSWLGSLFAAAARVRTAFLAWNFPLKFIKRGLAKAKGAA